MDVVAISWRTKDILLGECKWGQKAASRAVIQTLLYKTEKVLPGEGAWQVHYALFAHDDFTAATRDLARENGARLITLDRIETDMRRWLRSHR